MGERFRNYELYQTLSQKSKSRDISEEDKEKIIQCIPTFSVEEKEAIFLLILEHYRLTKNVNIIDESSLPYGVKKNSDSCISVNLQKLPTKLRQILLKFVNLVENSKVDENLS